ncbi:MAG: hypothetical protein KKB50_14615 [Planctomycetes bacterium]|nr:hypothetical protein [Planctomycetota bacterium]
MPTLFGRRYVRPVEQISYAEKVAGALILLATLGLVVAFIIHVALGPAQPATPVFEETSAVSQPADSSNEAFFPDPGLEGWAAPGRVEHYSAADLYQKINGRAEAYLEHNVASLTCGTYQHALDSGRAVDVYWYKMDTPADAMAMYSAEAPAEALTLELGDRGYQIGGAVFFCKDASYAQVVPTRLGKDDAAVALTIARRLVAHDDAP